MPVDEVAERLHRADHGGNTAVTVDFQRVDIADRIVGRPAELAKAISGRSESKPASRFGMVKTHWRCGTSASTSSLSRWPSNSARFWSHDGQHERCLQEKRDEELFPAVLALDASETFLQIPAPQKTLSFDERITGRQ